MAFNTTGGEVYLPVVVAANGPKADLEAAFADIVAMTSELELARS